MIDEMTNTDLIAYVASSEDSNETERELADRLHAAIGEIERLVATVQQLEAEHGPNT